MNDAVEFTDEIVGGVPVVVAVGALDAAAAPHLRRSLHVLCRSGVPSVAIDLRGVTFLDSSALGALVEALRQCGESGTRLRIVVNSARVRRIFEITGLTSTFELVDRLDEVGLIDSSD